MDSGVRQNDEASSRTPDSDIPGQARCPGIQFKAACGACYPARPWLGREAFAAYVNRTPSAPFPQAQSRRKYMKLRPFAVVGIAACAALSAAPALAQQYPVKPVRVIIP